MDIVFFVEHKDRECPLVTKIARKIHDDTGMDTCVLSLMFHSHCLLSIKPKMVVVPFALYEQDWPIRLVRELFGDDVPVVALTWEQMLFAIMEDYKRPRDAYVKTQVRHIAWNDGFKQYLQSHDVPADHIHVCGNPKAEELVYSESDLADCREQVAKYVDLSGYDEVVFFPMNFSWAWHTDRQVQAKIDKGFPESAGWDYRDFAQKNLDAYIDFAMEVSRKPGRAVIIRPHPSIIPAQYYEAFKVKGYDVPDNVHIIKELTVREWVAVADMVGSSWSTVCYDAQAAGKPAFLFAPYARPDWMNSWWTLATPNFKTAAEFEAWAQDLGEVQDAQDPGSVFSDQVAALLPKLAGRNNVPGRIGRIRLFSWKVMIKRFILGGLIHLGVKPDRKRDYFDVISFSSRK